MAASEMFWILGAALGLGLLVGLQRERAASRIAGVRTFPLITLLGAVCGLLAAPLGGWVVAAGLIGVAAASAIANMTGATAEREQEPGITTEIAILLMFAVGAMLALIEQREVAVAVGAATAALLHAKAALHGFVRRMGDKDVRAIMQFAVITFVILPVLPDRTFTKLEVLNPRHIWLMVVLVVGISLMGYLAYKAVGARAGVILGGLIGGAISSTATTVSYARRSREAPDATAIAAVALLLATCVMYARVLIEIAVVERDLLRVAAWPIGVMLAATALIAGVMWLLGGRSKSAMPEQANPSELKSAFVFGALYALVLAAVAISKRMFDDAGLYAVAALSGLTDMDAITLSTAQLVGEGRVEEETAWRAILIAALANLVFKTGIALALGTRRLFWTMLGLFGATGVVGALLLIFW